MTSSPARMRRPRGGVCVLAVGGLLDVDRRNGDAVVVRRVVVDRLRHQAAVDIGDRRAVRRDRRSDHVGSVLVHPEDRAVRRGGGVHPRLGHVEAIVVVGVAADEGEVARRFAVDRSSLVSSRGAVVVDDHHVGERHVARRRNGHHIGPGDRVQRRHGRPGRQGADSVGGDQLVDFSMSTVAIAPK